MSTQQTYRIRVRLSRNQIVGAWLWSQYRAGKWSKWIYDHHHRILDADLARIVIRRVGDIDQARERTCARDGWRMWASNMDIWGAGRPVGWMLPYVGPGTYTMTSLYREIMRGTMIMYADYCRQWAPAVWREAVRRGLYPARVA